MAAASPARLGNSVSANRTTRRIAALQSLQHDAGGSEPIGGLAVWRKLPLDVDPEPLHVASACMERCWKTSVAEPTTNASSPSTRFIEKLSWRVAKVDRVAARQESTPALARHGAPGHRSRVYSKVETAATVAPVPGLPCKSSFGKREFEDRHGATSWKLRFAEES